MMTDNVRKTLAYLRTYHIFMVLLYLCVIVLFSLFPFVLNSDSTSTSLEAESDKNMILVTSIIMISIGIVFFIIYLIGAIRVKSQTKFNYIYQLILLGIGFTSLLTMPFAIFIFIKMMNNDLKSYYELRHNEEIS